MEQINNHTPLPWLACHDGNCSCGMIWSKSEDLLVAATMSSCRMNETYNLGEGLKNDSEQFKANTKFIIEAVNNYYRLKEENERLREALKNLLDAHIRMARSIVTLDPSQTVSTEMEAHAIALSALHSLEENKGV